MRYPRLDKAIQAAAKWHAGEERDGVDPLPYSTHPFEVLLNLRQVGGVTDEDLLCAAALHDTVEDGVADFPKIEREFGQRVSELVREMTREEPTREQTQGMGKDAIWALRATMLLEEIRRMSPEAQTLKLADRLANIRDAFRAKRGRKLARYLVQSKEIVRIIPRSVNPSLWDALQKEVGR
jgi:guanosine-3',5'-bis(diphosphate) 3'-pyrophosphohydrolase